MTRRAACLAALALTGCDYLTSSFDTNEFSGDSYPINVDDSSGAVVVGVREDGQPALRRAVLDVLSPLTVIDRGAGAPVSMESTSLTILGTRVPGGDLDLPRAVIVDQQVVAMHPCQTPECTVGSPASPTPFNALVGVNAFAGEALRLRLADDQIFILPGIAGSDTHLMRSCDAVFNSPFWGGGTLVLGGTEVSFQNWRIAIDTCIAPNPARLVTQSTRGVNALLVLSTGIGPSLLGLAAYERYRELDPSLPAAETLPEETVLLPSGPVTGGRTVLPSIALVGNSSANPQAPCEQMWASHLLASHDCVIGEDCPCPSGEAFCPIPAVVEVAPTAGIAVLVVSDSNPTLQSLRAELRSAQPEVDGILGTEAIEALQLDIDVVHNRLVMSCVDRTTCGARVALPNREARFFVDGCLGDMPGPITLVE